MSGTSLYVLTDARGHTVACDGTHAALMREAGRVPLLAPITVHVWNRTGRATMQGGWEKKEEFLWP